MELTAICTAFTASCISSEISIIYFVCEIGGEKNEDSV